MTIKPGLMCSRHNRGQFRPPAKRISTEDVALSHPALPKPVFPQAIKISGSDVSAMPCAHLEDLSIDILAPRQSLGLEIATRIGENLGQMLYMTAGARDP